MDNNGQRTRAVITGMGVLSCLGHSVGEYWDGLTSGKSGIAKLTLTNTEGYTCKIGGEVRDFNPTDYVDRKESRRLARFSQLAIGATTEAIADAGLDMSAEDPDRGGCPTRVRRRGSSGDGPAVPHSFPPAWDADEPVLHSHDAGEHGGRKREPHIRRHRLHEYLRHGVRRRHAGHRRGGRSDTARRGRRGHHGWRRGGHLRARIGRVLHDPTRSRPATTIRKGPAGRSTRNATDLRRRRAREFSSSKARSTHAHAAHRSRCTSRVGECRQTPSTWYSPTPRAGARRWRYGWHWKTPGWGRRTSTTSTRMGHRRRRTTLRRPWPSSSRSASMLRQCLSVRRSR